jgi:high-affinity iron transporter
MRRTLAVVALAILAVVGFAGNAHALDVTEKQAVAELDKARALLDETLDLYAKGDEEGAFTAARNAYLDHFERVEIPLRVRDEGLTLDLEEQFADLRNLIDAGAPLGEVKGKVADVRDGLDRCERALSEPGLGAPLVAFVFSFITLFREGLEAVLVVAAILGYLAASRNEQHRGAVLKGVGLAGIGTVVVFILATMFVSIAPFQREILEAGTTIFAVVVLFYISFWLFQRLEHRRWMEFLSAKVWSSAASGSSLALVGVGFTAVFREGFETVLFYQALLFVTQGLEVWVAAGAGVALVVLCVLGYAIFRAGRRIPARQFLAVAVTMIMALSVAFLGNAVRGLQEAAIVPVTTIDGAPRLPIFLADLTGYHPTVQTIGAQLALAAVYVLGGLWVFTKGRAVKRARTEAADASAARVHSD